MDARLFSRHLPPAPPRASIHPVGWLLLAILIAGLVALIYYHPLAVAVYVLFVTVGGWIASHINTRRKLALASSRSVGNALCAFARSMDLRALDPWIVRAVFEELQPCFPEQARPFPIRPTDRLVEDLHLDPDDIEEIAQPLRRAPVIPSTIPNTTRCIVTSIPLRISFSSSRTNQKPVMPDVRHGVRRSGRRAAGGQ